VLLREALSSENTPFGKLLRTAKNIRLEEKRPASSQVKALNPQSYRMNRKLSPAVEQYRSGLSVLELARLFKMHRHTVAAHLERESVNVRPQKKMTPRLVARASQLYEQGNSLSKVGRQLGVEASTVGKALKRAGVRLRPPVADRWHRSRDD
jgi:DNA invertase Pin-like site-specific DNA recombinase